METRRDVFQAIADPTRRAILALVALNAMTPGAIAERFDSSRQTISKHISILQECDLLTQRQSGREIHYHFNAQRMKEVAVWLEPYRKLWEDRLDAMDDLLAEMQGQKPKSKRKFNKK
ncbi:MAG: winged helix-turn-helix transcriptional regulator [Bacteroidetes bacterium]|nr:winged helix-turn-helix transcriptional regulator [Bacteroidota bacterium]